MRPVDAQPPAAASFPKTTWLVLVVLAFVVGGAGGYFVGHSAGREAGRNDLLGAIGGLGGNSQAAQDIREAEEWIRQGEQSVKVPKRR